MKAFARHSAFWMLPSLLLAPLAVGHASPPLDYEQWKKDHARPPAGKISLTAAADYTVQVILLSPSDNPPYEGIEADIDRIVKRAQTFFADEMKRHGFGRKTFKLETDATGNVTVHHVRGKFTSDLYRDDLYSEEEISERDEFLRWENGLIQLIWSNLSDPEASPWTPSWGYGGGDSFSGIADVLVANFDTVSPTNERRIWQVIAHELGHAFGLPHDFRDDRYIMSYGPSSLQDQLAPTTAECLDVHRFFNISQTASDPDKTSVELLSTSLASPPNDIRLRFSLTDADELQVARLLAGEEKGNMVLGRSLSGTTKTIEFITDELTTRNDHVVIEVIDIQGNFTWHWFDIDIASLRPSSDAVFIPDAQLEAVIREQLGLTSGHSITELDMLDLRTLDAFDGNGLSDLTGLEYATKLRHLYLYNNRISDLGPLAGLTQLKVLEAHNNSISDLGPLAGLTRLTFLRAGGNPISDLGPLAGLTRLSHLDVKDALISDITPLRGLAKLMTLDFPRNQVRDISPVASMPLLAKLAAHNNQISDITPLKNLMYLEQVYLGGNPITDASPLWGPLSRYPHLSLDIEIGEPPTEEEEEVEDEEDTGEDDGESAGEDQPSDSPDDPESDPQLASLAVTIDDVTSPAERGQMTFTVRLDPTPTAPTTVKYTTTSQTATAGQDYEAATGTLHFEAKQNTATFTVRIRADQQAEPNETFGVRITHPSTGALLAEATGTITDDDAEASAQAWLTPDPAEIQFSADDPAWTTFTVHTTLDSVLVRANPPGSDPALEVAGGQQVPTRDFCPAEGNDRPTRARRDGWSLHVKACQAGQTKILLIDYDTGAVLQQYEVNVEASSVAATTALNPSYPNPFNSETVLSYTLPTAADIRLEVFTLSGQRVAILHAGFQAAGYHTIALDASDLASGVYLYRLTTPEGRFAQKFTLLR